MFPRFQSLPIHHYIRSFRYFSQFSTEVQCFSFYKYEKLYDLNNVSQVLRDAWSPLGVLGRVFIAEEGINGQVSVPVSSCKAFRDGINLLKHNKEYPFADMYLNEGELSTATTRPFSKLQIKIRPHLVNDGLNLPINMKERGKEITPKIWHEQLIKAKDEEKTMILDCRNYYEHDIGRFEGATRIMVDTFQDTFEAIDKLIEDKLIEDKDDKDKFKFLIYCTGGIRCEKVGSYLSYKGFKDVKRLQGGIINYTKYIKESNGKNKSLFKGKNFVFDARLSQAVTEDVLSVCSHCGNPSNRHVNCSNAMCGGLLIQCERCTSRYQGACSQECLNEVKKFNQMNEDEIREYRKLNTPKWKLAIPTALYRYKPHLIRPLARNNFVDHTRAFHKIVNATEEYASNCSTLVDCNFMEALRRETLEFYKGSANMMISPLQVTFLQFLIRSLRCKRILELGCFTGYSAIAMAKVLEEDGELITCDINEESIKMASKYIALSGLERKIQVKLQDGFDLMKEMRRNKISFDFIFLDSTKSDYKAYYDYIIGNDLLNLEGIMVVDNVLFHGEVSLNSKTNKGKILQDFNQHVTNDNRTIQVLLPFADGMTLIKHKRDEI